MAQSAHERPRESTPGRRVVLWATVAVGALAAVLAVNVGSDPSAAQRTNRLLDRPVPPFEVETLAGDTVTDEDLLGRSTIVNFWNTWCVPCLRELPALRAFYARHRQDENFVTVGIVRDDTRPAVRRFVQEEDLGWTIVFDPDGRAALDFATRGQPETFAISPSGRIVGFQLGESTLDDLELMLRAARRAG